MTTKEQERKALDQIKKILEGLEDGSYVRTAMDGMIEDAEQNIENDMANSWKDRAEVACTGVKQQMARAERAEAEAEKYKKAYIKANEDAERYMISSDKMLNERNKAQELAFIREDRIEELENEILKLKARLYDYMTA